MGQATGNFRQATGCKSKPIKSKQKCYDIWVTNGINSTNARNEGNLISITGLSLRNMTVSKKKLV